MNTHYQICSRTVMDTSDPDIWFDEKGQSSYAIHYDRDLKDLVKRASRGELQSQLEQIVTQIKADGQGKKYDCIIGVSGGVDSTFLILKAVELGLRPLAVHFDSGWNSELAVSNIANLVEKLRLDLVTDVVNWREMQDLQLSFFKASVANCDIPTDHAFPAIAFNQAAKYGIRYILSGFNYATESVLPTAWGFNASDAKHLKAIQRKFGTVKLKSYPTIGFFKKNIWYRHVKGIQTISLLNYLPFNKELAKQEIAEKLGWRDYGGKHYESIFTRFFQGYYLPKKFGFDKRRAHLSSLILAEQLSREDALKELESPPLSEELIRQDEAFIAKKLGITVEEFDNILARPKVAHQDYPNHQWLFDLLPKLISFKNRLLPK